MTNIAQVIGWKFNYQEGMTTRNGVITEFPNGIPSQADQDKWTKEYEEYVSANAYKDNRKLEYGTWEEQLDYIFHNGIEKWKTDMILPVKEKYPKGDS
jgi:hypothetical protein